MKGNQQKKWLFLPENLRRQEELARELRISTLLARCLLNRSISDAQTAKDYLQPELGQLVDPFRFNQMQAAVSRIQLALDRKERILIHGDYDVDGVSGTVLLLQLFQLLRADVCFHIPNRLRDGYSFGAASLEKIRREKATLVITIDNGVTAVGPITELVSQGVDVVITDHHKPSEAEGLPPAIAILNPNLPDSGYPHANLCGVAVAFKLAWAVAQSLSPTRRASPELKEFLLDAMGWVSIGTVTDIVPLVGENRVFTKFGLRALENSRRPGVRALLSACGLEGKRLASDDIGFRFGPRINAAGRLGAAEKAVQLFTTSSADEALRLSRELEESNEERRNIERAIHQEARATVKAGWDFRKNPVIVLGSQSWHAGVVGIVCSKLVDEFHAPAILIAFDGEKGRGSARSMPGFEVHRAISDCAPLLERFGGHAQAAGLEIRWDRFEEFRKALSEAACRMLQEGMPEPFLSIDAELPFLSLTRPVVKEFGQLAPHGAGNTVPVFATRGVKVIGPPRRLGKFGEHLQFQAQHGSNLLRAVAFGFGEKAEELSAAASISLAYTPKINSWNGRESIDLEVRDYLLE